MVPKDEDRLSRGSMGELEAVWKASLAAPVALVDCDEEIPCNPCESACPRGAIRVGEDPCRLPRVELGLCDGCGRCVKMCPGLAIVLLDRSANPQRPRVTVPWEMPGTPSPGERLWAVDARGRSIGLVEVVKVSGGRSTPLLVTVEMEGRRALKIRGLRDRKKHIEKPEESCSQPIMARFPVCRCEEVGEEEVLRVLELGVFEMGAVRRLSRVGLGACQGRFCREALEAELRRFLGDREDRWGWVRIRPPLRPIKLGKLGSGHGGDH